MIINGFDVTRRMPLFSSELRWAVRYGSKTQTRRLIKFPERAYQPDLAWIATVNPDGKDGWIGWGPHPVTDDESRRCYPDGGGFKCPFGKVGDIAVMAEPLSRGVMLSSSVTTLYARYHDDHVFAADGWRWKNNVLSSMLMPTIFGRAIVRYTDIHPEKLQSITDEDALKEGVLAFADPTETLSGVGEARYVYAVLWDRLYPKTPWESNPWVWVLEWEKLQ